MKVSVVVGNPKPQSRTLTVALAVARSIAAAADAELEEPLDLIAYAADLFRWPHEELAELNDRVAASEIAVIASPTYKGAYTGLLKAFLDRYPADGLAGVTAVPVMTGGSADHRLAVDTALTPLLLELGAAVPARGLYFEMGQMAELDAVVDGWAAVQVPRIVALASAGALQR
jgi:FMN reductase